VDGAGGVTGWNVGAPHAAVEQLLGADVAERGEAEAHQLREAVFEHQPHGRVVAVDGLDGQEDVGGRGLGRLAGELQAEPRVAVRQVDHVLAAVGGEGRAARGREGARATGAELGPGEELHEHGARGGAADDRKADGVLGRQVRQARRPRGERPARRAVLRLQLQHEQAARAEAGVAEARAVDRERGAERVHAPAAHLAAQVPARLALLAAAADARLAEAGDRVLDVARGGRQPAHVAHVPAAISNLSESLVALRALEGPGVWNGEKGGRKNGRARTAVGQEVHVASCSAIKRLVAAGMGALVRALAWESERRKEGGRRGDEPVCVRKCLSRSCFCVKRLEHPGQWHANGRSSGTVSVESGRKNAERTGVGALVAAQICRLGKPLAAAGPVAGVRALRRVGVVLARFHVAAKVRRISEILFASRVAANMRTLACESEGGRNARETGEPSPNQYV
jgi:hypothetical protein